MRSGETYPNGYAGKSGFREVAASRKMCGNEAKGSGLRRQADRGVAHAYGRLQCGRSSRDHCDGSEDHSGHYLTSPVLQPVLLLGAVGSGAVEEAGTSAEMGSGGFADAAATVGLPRLLADATTGRSSACTGLGTNRAAESTPDVSECTEMVCG